MDEKNPSVLMVDDEPSNLEVLELFLSGKGYHTTRAESGEDALKAVEESPPDLVLLDVMMPGMDGFEVCRRLKEGERTRFIPVVMVTALDAKTDKVRAIEAGADDFIKKPVDETELLVRLKSLMRMKSLHDELEAKYREVLELQELKDDLVRMLVHDFRNPITGVMSYLELMGTEASEARCGTACDRCAEYIQSALHMARKMGSMVYDLLDLTRMESGRMPMKRERVPLAVVVQDNIRDFGYALGQKGISTAVEKGVSGLSVSADRALLMRVVGNILANAIRHSPRGGRIVFNIAAGGGMTSLSIKNEGPAIPEHALERLFDKFYQVEARSSYAGSGVGLGLAFCKMVIKAHGGTIKAENCPDKGCRFTISLPYQQRW